MTEIQFLADLLLLESITEELKYKIIDRIKSIEDNRHAFLPDSTNTSNKFTFTPSIFDSKDICQHIYPNLGPSLSHPACMKCGFISDGFIINWGSSSDVNGGELSRTATAYPFGSKDTKLT